ncbi:hypothetical protein [Aurantibacter sp.]|uniref:hypothetical protein n=1 Tax=Aurantibacter sp. TaxID=2807103 RepID=UPI0035C7C13E
MVNKLLCIALFLISTNIYSQVGIGTTTPNSDALLDIDATISTGGLLLPRLNLSSTVNSAPLTAHVAGMTIYNEATIADVTPGMYYNNGTLWIRLGAGALSNDWSITGNNGTTYGTNFIGTTDNTDVSIQRNNIRTIRLQNTTTTFRDEIRTRNGSVDSGDTLIRLFDSADAGVIQINENNGASHRFHGNDDSVLNEQQLDLNFRIEGNDFDDVLFIDAADNLVSIGNQTPIFPGIDTFQSYAYFVNDHAVNGYSTSGVGVYGADSTDGFGVEGVSATNGVGVVGTATGLGASFIVGSGGSFAGSNYGVFGQANNAGGVGIITEVNGSGLVGFGGDEGGIFSGNAFGAVGYVPNAAGIGVLGFSNGGAGTALFGFGNFTATGTKAFTIDHPLDPENKKLKHFSVESDEVLNVYRGTASFDASGNVTIKLPQYFKEININFSYQLTPVGASMPQLHVSKEVSGNSFGVSGGKANKKVSWVVYAERNDKFLQANPGQRETEVLKTNKEQGKYYHPTAWGQNKSKAMFKKDEIKAKTYKKENNSKKGKPTKF